MIIYTGPAASKAQTENIHAKRGIIKKFRRKTVSKKIKINITTILKIII
jgi:hypothetical protein